MYRNEAHAKGGSQPYQRRDTRPYVVTHDFDGSAELTTTLVHALSDVSGIDVTDAGFTLSDHADPDALDQLFKPREDGELRMHGQLTFTVWGYRVSVYSDGQIEIVPPQHTPPAHG